jgi:UDP-glucose 4-epimerase
MIVDSKEKILNIGSGHSSTINDIINCIEYTLNMNLNIEYKEARTADVPINVLDIEKAKEQLDWSPAVDLETGIRLTYNNIINNEKHKNMENKGEYNDKDVYKK